MTAMWLCVNLINYFLCFFNRFKGHLYVEKRAFVFGAKLGFHP